MPEAPDPATPLWRAAQVFRLLSCIYALGFQIAVNGDLDRPALGWLHFGRRLGTVDVGQPHIHQHHIGFHHRGAAAGRAHRIRGGARHRGRTLRDVHDAVDEEDSSTADILHQLIDGLEKLAWLIKSENRKV